MNDSPTEHQKLLLDIEQMIADAPDAAARRELQSLRDRLNSPELLALARERRHGDGRQADDLVLEFHDPLLPTALTASACVIATAVCLFAIVSSFGGTAAIISGSPLKLWLIAALAGALSVLFTALSFMRSFTVRFDAAGMVSRVNGARWKRLQVGAMPWKDIRAIRERPDQVLEVRSASGALFEIPLCVVNYPILQSHLENMVMLYGDRP